MPAISDFLDRYWGKDQPKPPPISTGTAVALLVAYTILYVAPFYLSSKTRPSPTLSRDSPPVIRARVTSVSLTCVLCSGITFILLNSNPRKDNGAGVGVAGALHSMGYWPLGIRETFNSLLLTAILFAGPLYESLVVNGGWRALASFRPVAAVFGEWIPWRNFIVGPLTEELLFRTSSVPLMLLSRSPPSQTIFLSPLIFGLAHLHHFYEFRLTHPSVPVLGAVLRSALQLGYTTLFGAYATFLFLRTASLPAIFFVHAFCNVMGLPRLWGRVEPELEYDYDGDGSRGGKVKKMRSIMWSVVYYLLLVAGAVGWYKNLGTLTRSDNALVDIDI
ncbi:CaaX protease [Xylariaceae sp. FL0594]|nr:CaaX protease [Xylariaceae sp. FL0594]